MKTYLNFSIEKIEFGAKNYPNYLNKISKPPKEIYYRGDLKNGILDKTIAIVGTRQITNYGKQVVDKFVSSFVANGITVISGFMYGVDSEVHKKTIEYGGRTIAVFGNGLDYVYPPENEKLYSKILETGAVISEYEKDVKPQLWTYPARNRIVAGLSTIGVLVIEADEESGSMITAKLALKQKKKVWAIPGPITSKVSRGTNLLIKSGDAIMATTPEDIVKSNIKVNQDNPVPEMTNLEAKIYQTLQRESMSIDEIAVSIDEDIISITTTLTMMSLRGIISEMGGKFVII
ncbi:DNA-processing protein DprA [soil metagenome]